ncbi:MAG TPA: CcmD family protein [Melioribacteraceae bacterium]|nr:CcmD family protein [Melioribacteraceae bacterium]
MDSLFSFAEKNSIFIVLFIVLTIWLGIFISLFNIERRLKKIESELTREEKQDEE